MDIPYSKPEQPPGSIKILSNFPDSESLDIESILEPLLCESNHAIIETNSGDSVKFNNHTA